jgi:DNA-binding Lrp family transcriptional regulator
MGVSRSGEGEGLGSEVVERARRGRQEAVRDRELLWWVGRFRFVTARELSVRFGVSEQRVNARVRRLLAAGLLEEHRPYPSASRTVYLSAAGAAVLEVPRRKPPRAHTKRRHELALAEIVASVETNSARPAGARLLTERECRQAERTGERRWSVEVLQDGRCQRRWPDVVIDYGDRRRAIELELAVKHTRRLERIVNAYQIARTFEEVLWLVESPALRGRLELMCRSERWLSLAHPNGKLVPKRVDAYARRS